MKKKNTITIAVFISIMLIIAFYYLSAKKVAAPEPLTESNKTAAGTIEEKTDAIAEQSTSTVYTKWQSYKNKDGLSFNYPGDWKIEETGNNAGLLKPLNPKNCGPAAAKKKSAMCLDSITYELKENKDNLSIEDYFKTLGWREDEDYDKIDKSSVDNLKIYKFTATSAYDRSEGKSMWVGLPGGNFFAISGWYLIDDEPEILQKIFDSVKLSKIEN